LPAFSNINLSCYIFANVKCMNFGGTAEGLPSNAFSLPVAVGLLSAETCDSWSMSLHSCTNYSEAQHIFDTKRCNFSAARCVVKLQSKGRRKLGCWIRESVGETNRQVVRPNYGGQISPALSLSILDRIAVKTENNIEDRVMEDALYTLLICLILHPMHWCLRQRPISKF
jgi:hypothetical protein